MIVFIDSEYKCHISNPDGDYQEKEIALFDDKCAEFIEGYICTPHEGGDMIVPWKPYEELDTVQRDYERERLADAEKALAILLGGEV